MNRFAVLTDESQYEEFAARVNGEDSITTVYIVTDSEPVSYTHLDVYKRQP